ncbi:MAG: hypothetical protein ACR9NN_22405 [Nostochopsis sp.]
MSYQLSAPSPGDYQSLELGARYERSTSGECLRNATRSPLATDETHCSI